MKVYTATFFDNSGSGTHPSVFVGKTAEEAATKLRAYIKQWFAIASDTFTEEQIDNLSFDDLNELLGETYNAGNLQEEFVIEEEEHDL